MMAMEPGESLTPLFPSFRCGTAPAVTCSNVLPSLQKIIGCEMSELTQALAGIFPWQGNIF